MNLFEILSNNERIIIWSDVGDKIIYTWNQSLTLQCWQSLPTYKNGAWDCENRNWEEINIRTLSVEPKSFKDARDCAMQWHLEQKAPRLKE